jgi:hypothetical protein
MVWSRAVAELAAADRVSARLSLAACSATYVPQGTGQI